MRAGKSLSWMFGGFSRTQQPPTEPTEPTNHPPAFTHRPPTFRPFCHRQQWERHLALAHISGIWPKSAAFSPPPRHFLGHHLVPKTVSFPPAMPLSFWGLLASFHIQFTAISKLNIYALFRPLPSLSLFMGHKMSSTGNWYFWRFLAHIIPAYIIGGDGTVGPRGIVLKRSCEKK